MQEDIDAQEVTDQASQMEEGRKWLQEQKAKMLKYCMNKELGTDRILDQHYAALVPYFALWSVENRKLHKKYWVIVGECPSDHLPFEVAESERAALRHFSLSWQLKAEKMQQQLDNNELIVGTPEQHEEMIASFRLSADNIYSVTDDDTIWQQQP